LIHVVCQTPYLLPRSQIKNQHGYFFWPNYYDGNKEPFWLVFAYLPCKNLQGYTSCWLFDYFIFYFFGYKIFFFAYICFFVVWTIFVTRNLLLIICYSFGLTNHCRFFFIDLKYICFLFFWCNFGRFYFSYLLTTNGGWVINEKIFYHEFIINFSSDNVMVSEGLGSWKGCSIFFGCCGSMENKDKEELCCGLHLWLIW
jgi:hypothetical protein